jgi:hypothetical protein
MSSKLEDLLRRESCDSDGGDIFAAITSDERPLRSLSMELLATSLSASLPSDTDEEKEKTSFRRDSEIVLLGIRYDVEDISALQEVQEEEEEEGEEEQPGWAPKAEVEFSVVTWTKGGKKQDRLMVVRSTDMKFLLLKKKEPKMELHIADIVRCHIPPDEENVTCTPCALSFDEATMERPFTVGFSNVFDRLHFITELSQLSGSLKVWPSPSLKYIS